MRASSPYTTKTWTRLRTSAATSSTAPSWRSWSSACRWPTRASSASEGRTARSAAHALPNRTLLAGPPLPHCGGQPLEHGRRRVPAYAPVGNALAVAHPFAVPHDRLIALDEMALDHHAADGVRAAGDLIRDASRYLGLLAKILAAVAVAAVDDHARRQTGTAQGVCRAAHARRIVIRPLVRSAQYQVAVGIAGGR